MSDLYPATKSNPPVYSAFSTQSGHDVVAEAAPAAARTRTKAAVARPILKGDELSATEYRLQGTGRL